MAGGWAAVGMGSLRVGAQARFLAGERHAYLGRGAGIKAFLPFRFRRRGAAASTNHADGSESMQAADALSDPGTSAFNNHDGMAQRLPRIPKNPRAERRLARISEGVPLGTRITNAIRRIARFQPGCGRPAITLAR